MNPVPKKKTYRLECSAHTQQVERETHHMQVPIEEKIGCHVILWLLEMNDYGLDGGCSSVNNGSLGCIGDYTTKISRDCYILFHFGPFSGSMLVFWIFFGG